MFHHGKKKAINSDLVPGNHFNSNINYFLIIAQHQNRNFLKISLLVIIYIFFYEDTIIKTKTLIKGRGKFFKDSELNSE
jgi:hypothetical protein